MCSCLLSLERLLLIKHTSYAIAAYINCLVYNLCTLPYEMCTTPAVISFTLWWCVKSFNAASPTLLSFVHRLRYFCCRFLPSETLKAFYISLLGFWTCFACSERIIDWIPQVVTPIVFTCWHFGILYWWKFTNEPQSCNLVVTRSIPTDIFSQKEQLLASILGYVM